MLEGVIVIVLVAMVIFVGRRLLPWGNAVENILKAMQNEGEGALRRLDSLSPVQRVKVCNELIYSLVGDERWHHAKSVVTKLARDDEEAALHWNIELAAEAGEHEEVVSYCLRALELHPQNVDARVRGARSLLELGRVEEAIEWTEWAEDNPDPHLLEVYAEALYASGQEERADAVLEQREIVSAGREREDLIPGIHL